MTTRSATAAVTPSTTVAVASVANAATAAPSPINRGGCTRSGRLVTAEASAPTTKPSCTPMVRSASPTRPISHSPRSAGAAADAANQVATESTWTAQINASWRMATGPSGRAAVSTEGLLTGGGVPAAPAG